MASLEKFISYLEQEVANHSIYVWGAQGQDYKKISENWIRKRENGTGGYSTSQTYADAAISFWKKQIAAGYEKRLKAFDCSGLLVYWLLKNGVLTGDKNANGLKGMCTQATAPKRGYWVFRLSGNRATHIGVMVSDTEVIHAKGRQYGVVKEQYKPSYWHWIGKPKCFEFEAKTEAKTEQQTVEVIAGAVNVRDGGSTAANTIGIARRGQVFRCVGVAPSGWYMIEFVGKTGYISNKKELTKLNGGKTVELLGNVNVRTTGGIGGSKIGVARKGQKYQVIGIAASGWYKISFNGKTGYISNRKDLTKIV